MFGVNKELPQNHKLCGKNLDLLTSWLPWFRGSVRCAVFDEVSRLYIGVNKDPVMRKLQSFSRPNLQSNFFQSFLFRPFFRLSEKNTRGGGVREIGNEW